jgi:hypothetical protein
MTTDIEVDVQTFIKLFNLTPGETPGVYVYTSPVNSVIRLPLRLGDYELGTYEVVGISPAQYARASGMRFILTLDRVDDREPEPEPDLAP